MASSCILHQNEDATIVLIDIPRSIELAQGSSDSKQRLISSKPLEHPYPSVEPKTAKARAKLPESSLDELLLQRHLQLALDSSKGAYRGGWCLPRFMSKEEEGKLSGSSMKRKRKGLLPGEDAAVVHPKTEVKASDSEPLYLSPGFDLLHPALHQNSSHKTIYTEIGLDHQAARLRLPPHSTVIHGDIVSTRDTFLQYAPKYNLIILDPPWPNRSARRSKHYSISYGVSEIRDLLSNISVKEKLAVDGLVAVWVTNKAAFRDMVLGEGGLFKEWDVGLKEEWVWLKVTEKGEPICALDSVWRKPYEILLVGRGSPSSFGNGKPVDDRDERTTERGKRRVLLGVPDLHSRKPNLKKLMEELLGVGKGMDGKYEALEIFARNLTAGWWAWGDEACKFQAGGHWTPCT